MIEKKAVYTKKPGELIGNESVIFWLNTKSKIQMFKDFIYNSSNQSENSGLSLKHLELLLSPVISLKGKLWQPIKDKATKGSNSGTIKIQVTK